MSDNTPKNLEASVLGWIKREGYPLEMQVAHAFKEVGFDVMQPDHYIDPQTETFREGDIRAYQEFMGNGFYMATSFFVECKVSKAKPWVVFSASHSRDDPYLIMDRWMFSSFERHTLVEGKEIEILDLFSTPKRLGYGIKDAFLSNESDKEGRKNAYAAVMQVTNHMTATKHDWFGDKGTKTNDFPLCIFLIPIIILDGRLFECYLDNKREVVVSETEASIVSWPTKTAYGVSNTFVKILTISSLSGFVQAANKTMLTLSSHPHMQEMGLRWEKSKREKESNQETGFRQRRKLLG